MRCSYIMHGPHCKQTRADIHRARVSALEATVGIEPTIGVLQTPALTTWPRRQKTWSRRQKYGAEDEIRTRDPLLGKEVLYH
jgi:hypothetical protein